MQEETQNAWAAGIFDGEGCVVIKTNGPKGDRERYHTLLVFVGQSGWSVPPMLSRLSEIYGGSICLHASRQSGRGDPEKEKPRYSWQITSAMSERFLRAIRPYCVEKSAQVELALQYREECVGTPGRHNPDARLRSLAYRHELAALKR